MLHATRLTKARSYSDQFVTRYRCFSPTSPVSGFTRIAMIDLLRQPTPDTLGMMPIYYTNAIQLISFLVPPGAALMPSAR